MAAKHRFDDLIKAYFTSTTAPLFAQLMRNMAAHKKAYKIVDAQDCERLAKSQHHEEVVMLFKRPASLRVQDYLPTAQTSDCILALDGVANPHNLGAILRSAAHFGMGAVMSREPAGLQSAAALRVAEGGAEAVKLIASEHFIEDLEHLKRAGYQLVTTSSHAGESLYAKPLSKKTVIILGEESSGVSKAIEKLAARKIVIPGSGEVESLNVSVAAALMMGEWYRDWKDQD
jgi:TrmH RNA methyltransferase